jgi:YidC/Oxa1 family membrane protein insertase
MIAQFPSSSRSQRVRPRHRAPARAVHALDQDLSVKDPYYVTPILMTVTMWLQQQLMPAPADPVMKRVQSIMPWMFGFFFKDVPAGLVLYWLIQNILTIIQQLLLDRFTDLGPSSMKKTAEATAKS